MVNTEFFKRMLVVKGRPEQAEPGGRSSHEMALGEFGF